MLADSAQEERRGGGVGDPHGGHAPGASGRVPDPPWQGTSGTVTPYGCCTWGVRKVLFSAPSATPPDNVAWEPMSREHRQIGTDEPVEFEK